MSNYSNSGKDINHDQPDFFGYIKRRRDSGALKQLNARESRLLMVMESYADGRDLTLYPSLKTLAKHLSTSTGNVANILESLEAKGFVRVVSKGGGRNRPTIRQLTLPTNAIAGNSVKAEDDVTNAIAGNSVNGIKTRPRSAKKHYCSQAKTLLNSNETLLKSGVNTIAGNRRTAKTKINNSQTNSQADLAGLDSFDNFDEASSDENKAVETRRQKKRKKQRRLDDTDKAACDDPRSSHGDDIAAPAAGGDSGTVNQSDDVDQRPAKDHAGDTARVDAVLKKIGVHADNDTARRKLAKKYMKAFGRNLTLQRLYAVRDRMTKDKTFKGPAGFTVKLFQDPDKYTQYIEKYIADPGNPEMIKYHESVWKNLGKANWQAQCEADADSDEDIIDFYKRTHDELVRQGRDHWVDPETGEMWTLDDLKTEIERDKERSKLTPEDLMAEARDEEEKELKHQLQHEVWEERVQKMQEILDDDRRGDRAADLMAERCEQDHARHSDEPALVN